MSAVLIGAEVGLMLIDWSYHRWFDDKPKPQPANELAIPRVDDGAPYPIYWGRVRLKQPILAWCDEPISMLAADLGGIANVNDDTILYFLSMYFILGIPFDNGQQQLLTMWAGETKLADNDGVIGSSVLLSSLAGDSTDFNARDGSVHEPVVTNDPLSGWRNTGCVEFRNGNASQVLVDVGPYAPESYVGKHMHESSTGSNAWTSYFGAIAETDIPGYRGFASVFLHAKLGGNHWCVGTQPNVPAYSWEAQSRPAASLGPAPGVPVFEGDITRDAGDCNPIDAFNDICFGINGKLALPLSIRDDASWQAAAATCYNDGFTYSRVLDGSETAADAARDIFEHVDGVPRWNPFTQKIEIKLIRNDYDPTTLDTISPSNVEGIPTNCTSYGNTDLPNVVRVPFENRQKGYADDSGVAHDEAHVLGQLGETNTIEIRRPGCKELATANMIAARELVARCRTMMKLTVVVDNSFRYKLQGDPLNFTWPPWQIPKVVMRIATPPRHRLDGKIELDLIQDYFFVWRSQPPTYPGGQTLKTPGSLTLKAF